MSKTVKFNIDIKIDGKSQLATLAIDAKEVGKALGQVQKQAKGARGNIANYCCPIKLR